MAAPCAPCSRLPAQSATGSVLSQSTTPVRVPPSTRRSDRRIAYIEALLDSAPGELAQSANVLRAFGFTSNDTTAAFRGLSIAVVDTTGTRVSLLMGDGASVDRIPGHTLRLLATTAAVLARGSSDTDADVSLRMNRVTNTRDSLQLVLVTPVPRAAERCDCLLDAEGAIVAALSEQGTAAIVTDDGMVAGTYVPLTQPATRGEFGIEEARATGQELRPLRDESLTVREVLALITAGAGSLLMWYLIRASTRRQVRAEQLSPAVFDANTLVLSLAGEASDKLGRNIRLETHFRIAPAMVRGDQTRTAQAVRLLIEAARRAMPRGGTLSLTTRFAEITEEHDRIPPGHYIVLAVDDTGRPLPLNVRGHLLDATPARSREWSSASHDLRLVRSIVHAHGWWLHVNAPREQSNEISIYMPLAPESLLPFVGLQEALVQ